MRGSCRDQFYWLTKSFDTVVVWILWQLLQQWTQEVQDLVSLRLVRVLTPFFHTRPHSPQPRPTVPHSTDSVATESKVTWSLVTLSQTGSHTWNSVTTNWPLSLTTDISPGCTVRGIMEHLCSAVKMYIYTIGYQSFRHMVISSHLVLTLVLSDTCGWRCLQVWHGVGVGGGGSGYTHALTNAVPCRCLVDILCGLCQPHVSQASRDIRSLRCPTAERQTCRVKACASLHTGLRCAFYKTPGTTLVSHRADPSS